MNRKERFEFVLQYFLKHAPEPATELHYQTPFQLLVAVILSAQCTDQRVNMTTPSLFSAFPSAAAMSKATFRELFPLIKSISYPNSKAKHLISMAKIIHEQYHGRVPMTMEELVTLPGVGRKTANVVMGEIEGHPTMAVDTHVFRVSERLGLTLRAKTTLETEKQLVKHFPKEHINKVNHWLILLGRYTCKARKPLCGQCDLRPACKYYAKISREQEVGE